MSLAAFTAAYGLVRPYRPWRANAPRHPWKQPASLAEKLWYLAFIEITPSGRRRVCLPAEVLALLPPLPRPRPARLRIASTPDARLLTDLAAFLGTLVGLQPRLRWRRWLAPRVLRALNARLLTPDPLAGARSELATGRLRFLHYLCEAAGLVAVVDGRIQPSPQAWRWLDAEPHTAFALLREAIERDLAHPHPLWTRYHLPPVSLAGWRTLLDTLASLTPETGYTTASLNTALRPRLPGAPLDAMPLLREPLAWLGLVVIGRGTFALTAFGHAALRGAWQAPARSLAQLLPKDDALELKLAPQPPRAAYARLLSWATVEGGRLLLDAAAIRRGLALGLDPDTLKAALRALTGAPLSPPVAALLDGWVRAAHSLTLAPMLVLSADAATVTAIRQDWRLRPQIADLLSPQQFSARDDTGAPGRRQR
jgi:hypothetical protein